MISVFVLLSIFGPGLIPRPSRILWWTFLPEDKRVIVFPIEVEHCPGEEYLPFVIGLQNDLLAEIHNRKKVGDPFIVMYHFPGIDTIEDARSALDVNLVLQGEFICMGTEA